MDREYLSTIVRIVEKGVADGDFAPYVDPRIATLTLIGSLNWMTHWYRPGGPLPATAIAEQICTVFLQGAVRRSTS